MNKPKIPKLTNSADKTPAKAKAKKAKPKAKAKPRIYSELQKNNICAKVFALMAGGKSVMSIFKDKPAALCSLSSFETWVSEGDRLREYTRARVKRNDYIFEEMLDIAEDGTNDYMENKNGDEVLNSEHVQRSKLRIETRKWMLGKLDSKKYGEKVTLEGDEEKPFVVVSLGAPKEKPEE